MCKLHCIATTFKIMSGRGTAVEMDVRQHYTTIYKMLHEFATNRYEWKHFGELFECMNSMFGHHASKSLPIDRVASFVKRLIGISTQIAPEYAIAAMHQARKLMLSDPRLYNMLRAEGGNDRVFHEEEVNPDHTNALSCCLWELTLNADHYHQYEKNYARDLVTWTQIPTTLSSMTPDKVMERFAVSKTGNFRPKVAFDIKKYVQNPKYPKNRQKELETGEVVDWFATRRKRECTPKERKMIDVQLVVGMELKNEKTDRDVGGDKVREYVDRYVECQRQLVRREVLKEIKEEYKLLNQIPN